mmetsp:Transcript_58349/g.132132  ORF Transcript_58349/g.132132 Transcript_58349/m.132132 type:complete len:222 (-) Transcript_58349:400-1065(-)
MSLFFFSDTFELPLFHPWLPLVKMGQSRHRRRGDLEARSSDLPKTTGALAVHVKRRNARAPTSRDLFILRALRLGEGSRRGWESHPDLLFAHEPRADHVGVPAEEPALPRVDVEEHVLALGPVRVQMRQILLGGPTEPELELHVVAPVPVVELVGGVRLQEVLGHRVEHVEERLELELLEVRVLERRGRLHEVAGREGVLGLAVGGGVRPGARKGGVERLG